MRTTSRRPRRIIPTPEKMEAFALANVYRLCWACAEPILDRFGGKLFAYWCDDNPAALVGKSFGQGHEFVVVADRWLVDAWASQVEGLPVPIVLDLHEREDREYQYIYYGAPSAWVEVRDWKERRRERERDGYPTCPTMEEWRRSFASGFNAIGAGGAA